MYKLHAIRRSAKLLHADYHYMFTVWPVVQLNPYMSRCEVKGARFIFSKHENIFVSSLSITTQGIDESIL